jgi:hypothetical protein
MKKIEAVSVLPSRTPDAAVVNELRGVKRCKHENARVILAEAHWCNVFCDNCGYGWRGNPHLREARFHHFTRSAPRTIKPPKWVTRALVFPEDRAGAQS